MRQAYRAIRDEKLLRVAAGRCKVEEDAVYMVTALILLGTSMRPRLRTIADDLLAVDGIAEVYSVAGPTI